MYDQKTVRMYEVERVLKECEAGQDEYGTMCYTYQALAKLDTLATDRIAIVTRCSECRHCFDADRKTPYDGEDWWYCEEWDTDVNAYASDPYRFFCADGERREDEISTK